MQPNTNTKLLLYTGCAAAVSSSLSRKADSSTLVYYEAIGGFPGIWKLSARAGIAIQDALNRIRDPETKNVNFVELVGGMAMMNSANMLKNSSSNRTKIKYLPIGGYCVRNNR